MKTRNILLTGSAVCFFLLIAAALISGYAGAGKYRGSIYLPDPGGDLLYKTETTTLNVSHASRGYISASHSQDPEAPFYKLRIIYPDDSRYDYDLRDGTDTFPLTGGSGSYSFWILRPLTGTEYEVILTAALSVSLEDPLLPFLYPSQKVAFDQTSLAIRKARELTASAADQTEALSLVYQYVIQRISYDTDKAALLQGSYIPLPDQILLTGKGVCYDYAALLCAMLRCLGIPASLEVGYSGMEYHAWVRVYAETEGVIDGVIVLHPGWNLLDPSYASRHTASETLLLLGQPGNYQTLYRY